MNTVSKGCSSGIEDAVNKAITTSEEWEGFWAQHHANQSEVPAVPAIDFAKDIVVCTFLGTKSSGGWGVEIKGIQPESDKLKVLCEFEQPKGMATMALTQPFHMVTVAKTHLPLDFITSEAVPPPPKELTFMVTVKDDASDDKKNQIGEALKSLKGVTGTKSMFDGSIVTVRFDANEVAPAAAEQALNSVDGLDSIEKDGCF
mmetsp:Transcript_110806/g.220393  ORF Transcript_110806/g.220393 Transcript_110806/m.220393 type:complete len:202 (+) Transcript_110806:71-676(+)|eukprot:CAMPEP_0172712658 /NCGR_PEP_ID=MMETSP1074-20121228/61226_1 /TAXON_ID=2916 /ORGANISM="Ceratium fusus, Strain PA161109" /LENGTH=201 /DNA_ID=CAMNT_0013536613 /DNA_START=64 /DNA_END=669 /DNA_ORIENTATION=-